MGFNATRRYRGPRTTDIAILVAGVVIVGGLLLWGLFG
ncbi:MAG: hypothetical protein QOE45_473 [Frankiaceae bacterium]|jgi:hypothetical protein|nr:hypothetical protein [Frankiaceae bacterium]